MAHIEAFGETLQFCVVSPDEIARTAYYALRFGLEAASIDDQVAAQIAIRAVLPILGVRQLAMLLNAFEGATLDSSWRQLEHDIHTLAS